MRFHLLSLPHTNTTDNFPSCAFTCKVIRFVQMMLSRGHEVVLYSNERNTTLCTEHVTILSESERREAQGTAHYTAFDWGSPWMGVYNNRVIGEIRARIQPQDFIITFGGLAQKPVADAFPEHMTVEAGIGYAAPFANFRVYESYAWMHTVMGAEAGNAGAADGRWFDTVIPNQIDDGLYNLGAGEGGYALYMGRLIERKGYHIAQEVCQSAGVPLVLAGPGEGRGYGAFVGEVDAQQRARLMEGAVALFAPTIYVEPFGTVHIEAQACGTPVITSDWGVFTETVVNGVNGFRCRMFGEFVKALAEAPSLDRERIRALALSKYSTSAVGQQYDDYFRRLLTLHEQGWYT